MHNDNVREEYIRLIKKYISLNPDYKYNLKGVKSSFTSHGATVEEFDEAIRQITGAAVIPNVKLFGKIKSPMVGISLIVISVTVLISLNFQPEVSTKTPLATTRISIPPKIPKIIKAKIQNPIPQVYANASPIDAQKVFSFPQSNVPLTVTSRPKKEILGFFPYWMMPKVNEINLDVLTSISIFGLEVDGKGNIVTSHADSQGDGGWLMWKDSSLNSFIKKTTSNGIKTYLTLKSFNNENIENLVSSDSAEKTFISNALYLVNSKNLDGINLDFEYSGVSSDAVRDGFTRLVTNLNTELKRQLPNSTLTIDTYITSGSVPGLFDITLLSKQSDAFVIMGYDMHYSQGSPGPISPMGGDVNIIGLIQGYLEKVGPEKLILALPYYGYDWPINPASSENSANAGIIPYAEIAIDSKKYNLLWDNTSQTPSYTYTDNGTKHEVHFENVRSLGIKYDFVNAKGLLGVGIWALGYDGLNSDLQRLIVDKFSD